MALETEEIDLNRIIRQVYDSSSLGLLSGTPLVWSFRNGAREYLRGALLGAQGVAQQSGYNVTPVYDIELVDNPTNWYSTLRTAIRRSPQVFPDAIETPVFATTTEESLVWEIPTDEVADLEEEF